MWLGKHMWAADGTAYLYCGSEEVADCVCTVQVLEGDGVRRGYDREARTRELVNEQRVQDLRQKNRESALLMALLWVRLQLSFLSARLGAAHTCGAAPAKAPPRKWMMPLGGCELLGGTATQHSVCNQALAAQVLHHP